MTQLKTAPYGSWRSPITSDLIVAETISILDVFLEGDELYWLEGRPKEGGRYVLVRRQADGTTSDVNPAPFNARTRVHEYGGGSVTLGSGTAYYSHFADQRLYRQERGGVPTPLTPADSGRRYADGFIDPRRNCWVGIREDHSDPERRGVNAVNTIAAVDLASGSERVLVAGNDFYSSPRLSPDGRKLAWLTWNHPNMPWDATELWVADVAEPGALANAVRIAGGSDESLFQPEWSPDGLLYFISDRSNWWNLYRREDDQVVAVFPLAAEFGQPQWVFGLSTYAFLDASRMVCSGTQAGLGKLALLDLTSRALTPFELPFTDFAAVRTRGGRVALRAGSPTHASSVVMLDPATGKYEVARTASPLADDPNVNRWFARPVPVEFPTANGQTAFALYYPPANPDYRAPDGEKPPLVVKCHGGPTSAAGSTLDLRIQFWTSRGIAVLDVNYGGSTGYGRAYRSRLNGNWGVVDVDDCVNGARYLAEQGWIDEQRAVITGGSAGGYTALAGLAFRTFFKGGGSHYGVSDLEALVRDTHKFESRYLDRLIGPYPADQQRYRERSPIHAADRISAPVVFFQGDEDEIVPPNQTERMVETLRKNGVAVGYLLFAGEQHGFRRAENIQRALDAELYFFAALVFRVGLAF